jgi:sec-independent protein translocase protein TatA
MRFGPLEIFVVLVIVVLLFGPGRIGKIASELGSGIRNFREGLAGDKKDKNKTSSLDSSDEPHADDTP